MAKQPVFRSVKDEKVKITGFSLRVRAAADQKDIYEVVGALQFEQCDPMITNSPNIMTFNTVRLDRQANTTAGAANL